jgi:methylthioribose-1-phosphate isomerase
MNPRVPQSKPVDPGERSFPEIRTIDWRGGKVVIIDQTRLPHELAYLELGTWQEVAEAIRSMKVRGAPAIGVTGALGLALAASIGPDEVGKAGRMLADARPTAVNLRWGVERVLRRYESSGRNAEAAVTEAVSMIEEDIATNKKMGEIGAGLLADGARVLTHCNAGALATVAWGTALGVFRSAVVSGKKIHVFADESRPRLQGMKLTAWEMARESIPVTLLCDGMAAWAMKQGMIDCVMTGSDRIARNGDAANKIGTYSVAIAARRHEIPFYIVAPWSTVDMSLPTGSEIPIEERDAAEVTRIDGTRVAPDGVEVWNPAFDVTPAELITAIVTERGILEPPYEETLAEANADGETR